MAKKTEDQTPDKTEDQTPDKTDEATPDFGNRPEIASAVVPDMETLSHNWQSGSPAVDMRDVSAPLANRENLVAKLEAQEEELKAAKADKPVLTTEEYKERTKLDVSDPKYVNPSLDHHEVND